MQASALKHLAAVSDLARLDFATTRLTLYSTDEVLSAYYVGAYSAGQRSITRPEDVPDIDVEIDAARIKQVVSLFDDSEEVALSLQSGALRLKSKAHNLTVRTYPAEQHTPPPDANLPVLVSADMALLLREIELAVAFSAQDLARPIFTGIRLAAAKSQLGIQASNGFSVVFTTRLPAETPNAERVELVLPAQDVLLGLRLLASKSVDICSQNNGNNIVLRAENSWFRCVTVAGEWPSQSLSKITAPRERTRIKLSADTLETATASVKIFEAANDVQIVATDAGLLLRTAESEAGQYVAEVTGEFLGDTWYDVSDLALAAKIGSDISMELPDAPGIPTRVSAGPRAVYITSKVH